MCYFKTVSGAADRWAAQVPRLIFLPRGPVQALPGRGSYTGRSTPLTLRDVGLSQLLAVEEGERSRRQNLLSHAAVNHALHHFPFVEIVREAEFDHARVIQR